MSDAAALITAIGGLVTALSGLVGAIVLLVVKVFPREKRRTARNVVVRLAEAAEDGVITVEELQAIAEEDEA